VSRAAEVGRAGDGSRASEVAEGGHAGRGSLRVSDAYPGLALTRPGDTVTLLLEVACDDAGGAASLRAQLRDNGTPVAERVSDVTIAPGVNVLALVLVTPAAGPRGYEAVLELELQDEKVVARTAVLVAEHWRQAPRYGFLSEFPAEHAEPSVPGETAGNPSQGSAAPAAGGSAEPGPERVRELAKFHITVVQFYDWMYRHYRFLPPEDGFADAMGRRLSLATVKRRVAECRRAGMAALAYGAVYGAEPEFVESRPDWVLRDASGKELSLIDLFYITDIRPGAQWREHILGEFEAAVAEAGFDGIHMDQYGFPKWSYDAGGNPVSLAEHFGGLIDEAADRVARQREGAAVLFNAVNNWPIERVAASDQAAVYIEVWPPHDEYRDLVALIRRARDLSGKDVILAAYLEPFRAGGEGAERAALLATAVIAGAGGFHLLLGEGDAVLRDPYYPNHGRMSRGFARRMRRYYDHTAALHHYLFGAELQEVSDQLTGGINTELCLQGAPASVHPDAGAVWTSVKQRSGELVVNLVNLVGVHDPSWNVAKEEPEPLDALTLRLSAHFRVGRVTWSSPDEDAPVRELEARTGNDGVEIALPELRYWATMVLELT
jgi:dextranase